ncbi:sigma-70 family RNA polymerase sigma factor [Halopseudomonas salegens]|uniref:RNA polymerase sigma-70 factor, ECF subfamily n=1 Tax=Halopseudomonas salegens TaxID=1434072 RepID=A0A1H2FAL2_9GAMM|nr:sigma-70 family RNA polymerase sigma factor [Halopseudomonas salegens]SDU04293.1 RNA polymerase sigma-70 factor, ECF subfamily [Halopseudomonas salegens]
MPATQPPSRHDIGELYARHRGWLLRWLTGKTQCGERASDLLQDTFVRLLRNGQQREAREPQALLMAIAKRVLIDHWRRQSIEQAYLQALAQVPEAEAPSPEQQYLLLETLLEVDQLLAGLPLLARRAFLLAQLDGLKQADIALTLDISVSSVKRYLTQAYTHCYFLRAATREACGV